MGIDAMVEGIEIERKRTSLRKQCNHLLKNRETRAPPTFRARLPEYSPRSTSPLA